jgi:hypothetical protein
MELTKSQRRWFEQIAKLKNKIVTFECFNSNGEAVFSLEDKYMYNTAIVGKRGHIKYIDCVEKCVVFTMGNLEKDKI